jgi:hypothetical protein
VVIIFSIAELSLASCSVSALISISGFGMSFVIPLSSASAALAHANFLSTTLDSTSIESGSLGNL